jgi:cell division protein FtsQ
VADDGPKDEGAREAGETAAASAASGAAGTGAAEPVVAVDPRMRSRRIGVRREAGRKRLRRATLVLAVVAAVVGSLAAGRSPVLDVDKVTVSGEHRTDAVAVRRAAGIDRGDPMIGVDPGAAARRVERLPWVGHARVVRAWPATVKIEVHERDPAAMIQVTEARVALVDDSGRVLSIEPSEAEAQPADGGPVTLTGIDGRVAEGERLPADARAALTVGLAARDRLPGVISSVSTELDAALVEGGTVRFGSADRIEDKLTALETVLEQVDRGCLETLDVRVPGSPALTRNGGCP